MKNLAAILFFLVAPLAAEAQTKIFLNDYDHRRTEEDFTANVDLRGQYFLYSTVPNRILDDYSDYDHVPGEQMDVLVSGNLIWDLTLDVDVYAWIGENQWISRIGLIGELRYKTPLEFVTIGYGHHSWHNIDVSIGQNVGHQQDWALLRIDAPKLHFGDRCWIRPSIEPEYFLTSKEPLLIKEGYGPDEIVAEAMLALPVIGAIHDFNFELKPYLQYGHGTVLCGVSAEFIYNITPFFAAFSCVEFYSVEGKHREMVGIGIMLRLTRQ